MYARAPLITPPGRALFAPSPLSPLPPDLVLHLQTHLFSEFPSLFSRRCFPLLRPCPRSFFATPKKRPRRNISFQRRSLAPLTIRPCPRLPQSRKGSPQRVSALPFSPDIFFATSPNNLVQLPLVLTAVHNPGIPNPFVLMPCLSIERCTRVPECAC